MEEIGIEPHSFMGKLKDIGRERIEKHFLIFTFCFGMGVISYSAICRIFGLWFVEYVSLMENIGAAFIIPPLLIGLQKAVSKVIRPRPPLKEYLGMMKSELRMLGISLHDVHKRSKDFDAYLKKIYEKESKDRLTFKFLLLDPDSPFREQREKEEGEKIGDLRKEIKKTKDQLERIRSATSSNEKVYFKYYTYDAPPTHSLIWVDETMYVGPYLRERPGYESFWVKVSSKEAAYSQLKTDFEQLWHESEQQEELDSSLENHKGRS